MSTVMIRPYLDPKVSNHGLERVNMVIADNAEHKQDLRCLEHVKGIKEYVTGLNENSKEVQSLNEPERTQKIVSIRKTVILLERNLVGNGSISEDDIFLPAEKKGEEPSKLNPDFWEKVTTFKSTIPDKLDTRGIRIPTYWDKVELKCSNTPKELDTKDAYNILLINAIEAGGFGDLCAPSLSAAKDAVRPYKFYLDKVDETAEQDVKETRSRNKAGRLLEDLMDEPDRLFYVAVLLVQYPLAYRRSSSTNLIYSDIDKYLDGRMGEKSKLEAIRKFSEKCNKQLFPTPKLKLMATVRAAIALNIINTKGDNVMYFIKKMIPVGKTYDDAVAYLSNDANTDVLGEISDLVEAEWKM